MATAARPSAYVPWVKILTFEKASLNSYLNPANIPDTDWQDVTNVIFDYDVAEPARQWYCLNAVDGEGDPVALESGARIDGVFRSFDKFSNVYLLAAVNKHLYSKADAGAFTEKYNSFTVENTPYSFINYKNKTLITNGTDDIVAFDPNANTVAKYGLNPPRFFKRVAYFEADTAIEAVTGTGTNAVDLVRYDPAERTGRARRSWRLTAVNSTTPASVTSTPASSLNLSTYDNGETAGSDDWFCLSLWHSDRSALSTVTIDLYSSGTAYSRATIPVGDLDPNFLRDNIWTYHRLSRADFIEAVATFTWGTITKVVVTANAVGATSVVVNVDNIYITNRAINATPYAKVIEDFGGLGWTPTAGMTLTPVYNDFKYIKMGMRSLKVALPAAAATYTISKTVVLDLSKYSDDVTSQLSDEICLWVWANTTANMTHMMIDIMQSDAVYWHKELSPGTDPFKKTTAGCESYIRVKKSDFTATGGITTWADIIKIRIQFEVTGQSGPVYLDKWVMEEYSTELEIATMETATETWVFDSPKHGLMNTDAKHLVKGSESVMLKANPRQVAYATLTKDVDVSQYTGGYTSGSDDIISFWLNWTNFSTIDSIELRLDIGAGAVDFATDYYSYLITKQELKELWNSAHIKPKNLANKSMYIDVKKSQFNKVGTTSANLWDDVQAIRFYLYTGKGDGYKTKLYIDDLHMRRVGGMNGLYQWAVCFVTADGTKSALSEWSEIVQISGSKAVLTSIPVSGDAECAYREVYRRGGTLGDEARYAFTIWDNTSTIVVDMYKDYELGGLVGEEIPTGTIRSPKGKVFGPIFKGRLTMYQVTNQEDCLYFSNSGYGHAWDELKVVGFGSRIMGAWVDDDILYVSTKNGLKKIVDDLYAVSLDPGLIQETGISMSVLSPWSFAKKDDNMLIATRDGICEFNGYQSQIVSDKIKDFFEDVHTQTDYTAILYSDNHLFLYHANSTPDTFECYLGMGKTAWRESNESFCTMCLFDAPGDSGEVCAGSTDGFVYTLDRLNGNIGVDSWMTSKDFSADDPFMDLILDEAHILAVALMPDTFITVHFRANQADVAGASEIIEPDGVYCIRKIYLSGNEFDIVKGTTVGIDLEGTDSMSWKVKAIKLIGRATPRVSAEEVL